MPYRCGLLSLALTLSGLAGTLINGMPRFVLAGLLIYSGVGFLVDNLWEARRRMTKFSFATVWCIFLLNCARPH